MSAFHVIFDSIYLLTIWSWVKYVSRCNSRSSETKNYRTWTVKPLNSPFDYMINYLRSQDIHIILERFNSHRLYNFKWIWLRKIDSNSKSMNEPNATVEPLSLTLACEKISEAKVIWVHSKSRDQFCSNEIISPQILDYTKLTWNTCNLDLCWWSEKSSQLKELLILRDFSICSLHGSGGFTDVLIELLTFPSQLLTFSLGRLSIVV